MGNVATAGEDILVSHSDDSAPTLVQQLTARFYGWEQRGRGWQVWDYPVELEPPFRPFIGHLAPAQPAVDDARQHTLMSAMIAWLRRMVSGSSTAKLAQIQDTPDEPEPAPFYPDHPLIELQLSVPITSRTS